MGFQKNGSSSEADSLLKKSIERNPHVPEFLLGRKKIPKKSIEYIKLGDETEAISYVNETKVDWELTSGALEWLAELSFEAKSFN